MILTEIQIIKNEKQGLLNKKADLTQQIKSLNLTKNRVNYKPHTIAKETLELRQKLANEIVEVEKDIIKINSKIQTIYYAEYDLLKTVLKESLGEDLFVQLFDEVMIRRDGGDPTRIKINITEANRAKEENKYLHEKVKIIKEQMLIARREINKYIISNEPEINKADYFKHVSSINTCLPTVNEINKL